MLYIVDWSSVLLFVVNCHIFIFSSRSGFSSSRLFSVLYCATHIKYRKQPTTREIKVLKRVNENEFKLNIQLFAEGDENKDDNKPEIFTKEEFEAKLKEVDDKYASIITGYESKFKELEAKISTPKAENKKEDKKVEDDIPAWAKALIEKNEQLEKSILQNNDTKLSERKISLKETFGLEDSDLEDIKDEKSLNTLEKNLKKLSEKKEIKRMGSFTLASKISHEVRQQYL